MKKPKYEELPLPRAKSVWDRDMLWEESVYKDPIWQLWKCEKGNRWSCVKGGLAEEVNNSPCLFSGCKDDHLMYIVEETKDPDDVHDWFLNNNQS